jgi:antitoxin YefM
LSISTFESQNSYPTPAFGQAGFSAARGNRDWFSNTQGLPQSSHFRPENVIRYFKINLTQIAKFNFLYLYLYPETYKLNYIMLTTTISDFRKDIKQYLDRVTENFETLIINRGKDRGVVIMSLDEYNSLNATYHELSSKTNEKRLDSAIEKLRSGSSFHKDLIEQ